MHFELRVALRYLFSKKKQNAINIVSGVCATGICVASLALVCILSVYNGFQSVVGDLYSSFDPDLRIQPKEGKIYPDTLLQIAEIKKIKGIKTQASVLSDGAVLMNGEKQTSATLCGVDANYHKIINKDVVYAGEFNVGKDDVPYMVLGVALAAQLNASIHFVQPITLYAPIHDAKLSISNPEGAFNQMQIFVSGLYFVNQQETDSKFAFIPINVAREMYGYGAHDISHIDIKIEDGANISSIKKQIEEILSDVDGHAFEVLDKETLHADFYRMLQVEKWVTFLILFFVLMIAIVNIIGSLSMLIIEKKNDIQTLKHLGATNNTIRKIFLLEGWLVTAIGCIAGVVLGLLLCGLQSWFGIIRLSEGTDFVIEYYPVDVQFLDIIIIIISVLSIGLITAWYPTKYAE
mgnify:FL=1